MTYKNLNLILVLLLIASVGMWAQTITPITGTTTATEQSADIAGHMTHGCYLCHVPHTTGTTQQPGAGISFAPNAVYNSTGVAQTGVQGAGTGLPNAGTIYLWGQALSPITYTTWDGSGGTLSSAGLKASSPAVHSIMCLSCHDGAVGANSYDTMSKLGGAQGSGATAGFGPGSGIASTFYTGSTSNSGWAGTSGLLTDHPVHALYPTASGQKNYGQYWGVTINPGTGTGAGTVSFNDSSFIPYNGGSAYAGHPAKLYTDGTSAFVECTSCHEPHRYEHVAFLTQGTTGTWVVDTGTTPTTVDYIRGPFNIAGSKSGNAVANGEQNAGFCRSCHFAKSANYINNAGVVE